MDAAADAVRLLLPAAGPYLLRPARRPRLDNEVHPYVAESITPNDDSHVWTVTLRSGITFHDGTDLDADAAIKNLQTGRGGLPPAAKR